MVIRSTFLFSHWNSEGKTDDPLIVNSFAFTTDVHQPWTNPQDCYFEYLIIRFDYLIIHFKYLIIR